MRDTSRVRPRSILGLADASASPSGSRDGCKSYSVSKFFAVMA